MRKFQTIISDRRCLTWVFLCLYFTFTIPVYAMGEYEGKQGEIDSLSFVLSKESDPKVIMPVLSRLSKLKEQTPEQIPLLKQLYALAMNTDSVTIAYGALRDMSLYYYNLGARDSLLYWAGLVDSIAASRNEYPEELFYVRSYDCKDLIWKKDFETAMSNALNLYQVAKKTNNNLGLMRCLEIIGLIYRSVACHEDASQAFQEILDIMDQSEQNGTCGLTDSERLEMQMRIMSCLLESCYRSNQFDKAEEVVSKYKACIEEQEALNREINDVYPIKREYWLYYSLCLEYYVLADQMDKAKIALENAERYDGNLFAPGDYVRLVYLFSLTTYYKKIGDLPLALQYINKVLKIERLPDELQLKADILKEMGQLEDVFVLYDEIYNYRSKVNDETFIRQINQLRTLHNIYDRENQMREMEHNRKIMIQKETQLCVSFVVISILLVILYILSVYIRRANAFRRELQHEKEALLEVENKLIREKIKAEEASRMKSAFVANMSHEIRTPLNAIVGFSDLLMEDEDSSPAERKSYAKVIKNNTELLLTLLNDVLDLSHMETGDMSFHLGQYPLDDCCQMALDSIRHRVPESIRLTYTPDERNIIVNTDRMRLQQLLTNFLTNSIKFTEQGEINLSYTLEEDGKNVRIMVTDTGSGIPKEKQKDVFKRFEKLDDYKSGAGLGLSICGIIAEQLNGSIDLDPNYTGGARFFLIHPCWIEEV